jgi:Uma2 family endonuclease
MQDVEIAYEIPVFETETHSDYETERGKPMPNIIHGTIQAQLVFLLKTYFGDRYIFPSELSLATNPSTTPDVSIYPKRKLDLRETEAKEAQMPLTAIEILSPSQTIEELQDKAWDIYFPAGVLSSWVVLPSIKAIQILTPDGQSRLFYENTLIDPATGIQLDIKKVFEDLL